MPNIRFGDARLAATLEQLSDHLTLTLDDLAGGKRWGPVPLLALEVFDKMQDRVDRLTKFRIDAVEPIPDGAHVTLGETFRRVALGLWLRIKGGELIIRVQPSEVYEHNAVIYRIAGIDLLPGLAACTKEGEMLLPLNTGALCRPANKPKLEDKFLIYGEQSRWELLPTLPVCAVKNPDGGLMMIATRGAAETSCRATTDGRGGGSVGFGMHWRTTWIDKVEYDLREIHYVAIPPGSARANDITVFTAKRLRRHVMEDFAKPTLRQRISESPELAYVLDAYIMKLFYGIQRQGIMMYGNEDRADPRFQLVMTFEEAGKNLQRLKAAGIDKVYTQSVGWNPRGHDGAWPTRFPIDERLGGEEGFRALINQGHAMGYRMNVHDNHNNAYEASPEFNVDEVLHDMHGHPNAKGFWGGGVTYAIWVLALGEDRLRKRMHQVKELGIGGMYYVDAMGNPLYCNYHPKHMGSRSDYARGIDMILRLGKEIFGSVGTECGFLYNSITPDIVNTPGALWHLKACSPEWPATQMVDRRVPVWQLAMHGLVVNEVHGEHWSSAMFGVLMGDHPRTEWSARPGVMPVLDDPYIARLKAMYDLVIKRFGHHQLMEITDYELLDEQVEKTTFDDGTTVVADFKREDLKVNGKTIERPPGL